MDAPPLTHEDRRELAELRSRAYGPDADIDGDAGALARLHQLEELARTDALEEDGAAPKEAPLPRPASAELPVSEGDPRQTRDAAEHPRPRWGRVPVWAYVTAAAAGGLCLGLAVPALTPPHPIATLRAAPAADGAALDFGMFGIPAESSMRYEPFRDLEVWSADTEQGSTCLVVTAGDAEWMAAGCAPAPLQPTADITFSSGIRQIDGLDLADGSVLRFVLRDGVIEVWLAETDETA